MKAIWSWEAGLRIFKVALVRKLAENLRNFSDGDFFNEGNIGVQYSRENYSQGNCESDSTHGFAQKSVL